MPLWQPAHCKRVEHARHKSIGTFGSKTHARATNKKHHKKTIQSNHQLQSQICGAENKLMQQFSVAAKNKVWVSDITYIATWQGWLYLTSVIDLMNRKVIGWSLSATMLAKHTSIAAFNMALINSPLKTTEELIFHSDRGIQYACEEFTSHIKKYPNITTSMSRKGNCWDNAVAESFFKILKVELVYHHQYQTRQQAQLSFHYP